MTWKGPRTGDLAAAGEIHTPLYGGWGLLQYTCDFIEGEGLDDYVLVTIESSTL